MTPSLSLVYNSQSGSNILGQGWSLSGFSAITRANSTLYYNGINDNIDFLNDELLLDGQHLIKVAGTTNEYRTETDMTTKIIFDQTNGSYGDYFKVYRSDGTIAEYGNSGDSRQLFNPSSYIYDNIPLAWHLNKVTDQTGRNSMSYRYEVNDDKGELHPSSIQYTGENDNSLGVNMINFLYDTTIPKKLNQTYYFDKGAGIFMNQSTWLLKEIKISTIKPENIYSDYLINYDEQKGACKEYFLKKISIVNITGVAILNPTNFDWSFYKTAYEQGNFQAYADYIKANSKICSIGLDITGDQKDEIAVYKSKLPDPIQPNVYENVITVYLPNGKIDIPVSGTLHDNELHAIDWDNNGDDELLFVDSQGIKIYNYDASSGSMNMVYSNTMTGKLFSGDFTGDAVNDILVVTETQCSILVGYYNESNHSFGYNSNNYSLPLSNLNQIQTIGDFNGDGNMEILKRQYPDFEYDVYGFNASGGFYALPLFTKHIADFTSFTDQQAYYADFNGDGKTDICYLVKNNATNTFEKHTYFSVGNIFLNPQFVTESYLQAELPSMVEDFNNDGRADFVNITIDNYFSWSIGFTQPDGYSLNSDGNYISFYIPADQFVNYLTADMDGNGIRDIVVIARQNTLVDPGKMPSIDELFIAPFIDDGPGKNAIKTITDGFGVKTQVDYTTLGTTGSLFASFPIAKPRFKDMVVSESYTIGDNEKKWNRNTYTFATPLTHLQGKGFLGFKTTKTISWQNNLINTTSSEVLVKTYGTRNYYHVYPMMVSTFSMADGVQDKLLSETVNTFDVKVPTVNSLNYIPVVTKTVTKSWDNDAIHSYKGIVIRNQKIEKIDDYGYSLEAETIMDETATTDNPVSYAWKKTVLSTYVPPDVSNWLNGFPHTTEVITTHKDSELETSYQGKTIYHYYAASSDEGFRLEYKENIPNNNSTDLKTENWYEYKDDFGNTTSETLKTTIDGFPAERKVEYAYKQDEGYQGRFLTSKTVKAEDPSRDQITTYSYDLLTGKLLTVTDRNKLVTTNQYDILGRLTQTLQPDGTSDVAELYLSAGFTDFVPPQTALYYSVSYKNLVKNAGAWGKTYTFYDTYSRPLRIVTQGLQGELIYTDYTYNETGRIAAISEPYPGNSEPTQWTTNTYDALGRVTDLILPTAAVIHTDFTGLTTKVTNTTTGIWKETTVDVVGNPVEIKDPSAGSIKYMYNALAKVRSINSQGAITLFSYDDAGNQAQVNDPDAGVTAYRYNGFGELRTQTDARNNINTITYDKLGRIHTKILMPDNETSLYTYEQTNTNNGFGQLLSIAKTTNNPYPITTGYVYDNLARVINKTETIDGNSYTFAYAYSSSSGMIENYTYPSNYTITYLYSPYGHMESIVNFGKGFEQTLWTATAANARGQITDFRLGNGLTTHKGYDAYGMPESIVTKNAANTVLQNLAYNFDPFTGNLTQKAEIINSNTILTETYEYDPILKERLTSWQVNAGTPCAMQYTSNGNIQSKSDVNQPATGQYTYGASAGPHAVTGITQPTSGYLASANNQSVLYNGNNKVSQIVQYPALGAFPFDRYSITYGTNDQRIKSETSIVYEHTAVSDYKYYFDNFEVVKMEHKGITRNYHYLMAGDQLLAIMVSEGTEANTLYYIHTDYQGNYNVITDGTGTKLENLAFDPWGRRRNPTNWSFTNVPATFLFERGYTGHEHLDRFGLINMNGRVYDPALARFLSPDPFITNPANSQNYNRYSYCLNNPLKYTDPSGYNQHEKPWDYDMEPQLYQIHFGGSGGGWSNWSNQFAGAQAHDFIMMNSTAFNNVWGKGASDIGRALYNDPVAFAQWSSGKTSIESIRNAGGYYIQQNYSVTTKAPEVITVKGQKIVMSTKTGAGKISQHWVTVDAQMPSVPSFIDNVDEYGAIAASMIQGGGELTMADALLRTRQLGIVTAIEREAYMVGKVFANAGRLVAKSSNGLMGAVAVYKLASGTDNTSTWVDVGASGVLYGAAILTAGTVGLPIVAVAGFGYAIWSLGGGSDWIDNNWGYRPVKP